MTDVQNGSATIYQFPPRGRFAQPARSEAELKAIEAPSIAFGSGWYHDEAIEAERTRKG